MNFTFWVSSILTIIILLVVYRKKLKGLKDDRINAQITIGIITFIVSLISVTTVNGIYKSELSKKSIVTKNQVLKPLDNDTTKFVKELSTEIQFDTKSEHTKYINNISIIEIPDTLEQRYIIIKDKFVNDDNHWISVNGLSKVNRQLYLLLHACTIDTVLIEHEKYKSIYTLEGFVNKDLIYPKKEKHEENKSTQDNNKKRS